MYRLLAVIFVVLFPQVGYVSGQEHADINSDKYHLSLYGGISSWDYSRVTTNSNDLDGALLRIKPKLDQIVEEYISQRGLPISNYNMFPKPNYIDGVLIESDPDKEFIAKHHFLSYYNAAEQKLAIASISQAVLKTSFKITLTVLVTERLKKDDIEQLALALIESIQTSKDLLDLLH